MELDAKIKVYVDPYKVFDKMNCNEKRRLVNESIAYADSTKILECATKALIFDEVVEAYLYKSTNTHIEVCEWLEKHAGEFGYVKKEA